MPRRSELPQTAFWKDAPTVRGCAGDLQKLWDMVRAHPDRDVLLNDGKKWLQKVGPEFFHDESQARGGRVGRGVA